MHDHVVVLSPDAEVVEDTASTIKALALTYSNAKEDLALQRPSRTVLDPAVAEGGHKHDDRNLGRFQNRHHHLLAHIAVALEVANIQ